MQFIDLEIQYQSIKPLIDQAILKVLNHGQYILGPEVFELEVKLATYSDTKYCVSCPSGTDALLMSLMVKGIGRGDADYNDFYIHKLHHTRKYSFDKSSINLNESIGNYDLVILSADHDQYDYEYLQNNSKLIVDTRGRFRGNYSNIISA